jgi:hypothetical protein
MDIKLNLVNGKFIKSVNVLSDYTVKSSPEPLIVSSCMGDFSLNRNTPCEIRKPEPDGPEVHLIYFCNLGLPNTKRLVSLVKGQLGDVIGSKFLLSPSHFLYLHFVLSAPKAIGVVNAEILRPLGVENHPQVVVRMSYENLFEYPGIEWVYSLAVKHPRSIIGYFHSKGASHKGVKGRHCQEVQLTRKVTCQWDRAVNMFQILPRIKICAATTSKHGLGWYNFWWARASHLAAQPEPVALPPRKWHWECWIGSVPAEPSSRFNLVARPKAGMCSLGSSYSRGIHLDNAKGSVAPLFS